MCRYQFPVGQRREGFLFGWHFRAAVVCLRHKKPFSQHSYVRRLPPKLSDARSASCRCTTQPVQAGPPIRKFTLFIVLKSFTALPESGDRRFSIESIECGDSRLAPTPAAWELLCASSKDRLCL